MIRDFEQDDQYKIKIILIGDSGVGKTNIRERFCKNKFDPFSTKTIGVQFSTRKFSAPFGQKIQKYTVYLWDMVGQIDNAQLIPSFFKSAVGVIYVFDLTNSQSLENLRLWREKVKEYNSAKTIDLLLGNKKELRHLKEVEKDKISKLSVEFGNCKYSQVSALEQSGGIQQVIYQYLSAISNEFNFGMKRPNKIKKQQQRHRSCI